MKNRTKEFKDSLLKRLNNGETAYALHKELNIPLSSIGNWRRKQKEALELNKEMFLENQKKKEEQRREDLLDLFRTILRKTFKSKFEKKILACVGYDTLAYKH